MVVPSVDFRQCYHPFSDLITFDQFFNQMFYLVSYLVLDILFEPLTS